MPSVVEKEGGSKLQGVKVVEFYKLVWSKWDRVALFSGLVIFSWAKGFSSNVNSNLLANVTNLFQSNNLISILSTVLYILQCVLYPLYSKLSDIYGRAQCYTVAIIFYMASYVVMACANSYEMLVGGRILYAFGLTGVTILGPITIADITNVVDRGLAQALYNVPGLINLFVGTLAGQAMFSSGNWRFGFGMLPIIVLATSSPLIFTLWKLYFQVRRAGLMDEYKAEQKKVRKERNLNFFQKCVWFMEEIDAVGSVLMVAGLCLILLPLVLANSTWGGWGSRVTIGTLVAGVVAWGLFTLWELKFAKKPIVPLANWETRTPIYGVLALSTVTVISSTNWQYYTTYLRLSRQLTASQAQLLERGYNVAYIVCEVIVGLLMKRFRVWRPFVWTGVSLIILGVGLMIPARQPTSSDAFVVVSQTIVGIGSGFLYTPMLVAIQSSVPHKSMATATAMMQVGGSIAASIGSTMAGSIWNNMLPIEIAKRVSGEYDYAKIVGNVVYAQNLPEAQYHSVVEAYGHVQMILSIIAMSIAVLTFCFTLPMKGFGLEEYDTRMQKKNEERELAEAASTEANTDINEKTESYDPLKANEKEVQQRA
ncbi:hypothetical protein PS15m_010932 [Mucor circinelloides]